MIRMTRSHYSTEYSDQYISTSGTLAIIREIVQWTIGHSPRVLINTTTGRLCNKAEQASAFESLPIFKELVSSMATHIDKARIKREVRQYFRYVMLSHTWEENEPPFQEVIGVAVYDLAKSRTHDKLKTFCEIVWDSGFNWAWSDTCCIDKSDHFVLQEALVAMFKWYHGSAMMIVSLYGVRSPSRRGALVKSKWNTRGWTLQEYFAAKVVRFYTEDWTLYLDLELPNHKESPEVIEEMEQATKVSAQQLMALRPGLTSIREKLRLASTRQTTVVEDAAYSLLGIFSVSGISPIYGEGEKTLGHLLAHILAGSGDVSILAWTGESGGYNSCLPAHITVFNEPPTSHLPPPIRDAEMETIIAASHSSSFDLDMALALRARLAELRPPWFTANRMILACIAFELPSLSLDKTRPGYVYCANTSAFGVVEIKTSTDLSEMNSLYLIHPWLNTLLEHEAMQSGVFAKDGSPLRRPGSWSPRSAVRMAQKEGKTRVRRLVARLRQPFGALLVRLELMHGRVVGKRMAADSLISVKLEESFPLADVLDNVRVIDIL